MKIAALIARILLGLLFVVSGLNGFLHFFPMGPTPTGVAGQFAGALFASHFFYVVSGLQLLGGALLLSGFYVPLGLTLLGPVIVNILLFHLLMEPKGLITAFVVTILWAIVALRNKQYFAPLFTQKSA